MKTLITTIILLFASVLGFGQTSQFSRLDGFFKTLEEQNLFFGTVAVSSGGELLYSKAIGMADVAANRPNTSKTKLRIGSISKTFTAALVMKAVEIGKVGLDDSIEKYFPQVQNANSITIRHLLNHRSGITNFTDRSFFSWYTQPLAQTALLDTIVSKGIDFEPNTSYQYSNSNYVLLTFILEEIFDNTYAEILKQYISEPLGLANTHYGRKIDLSQNEARSYRMKDNWTPVPESDMSIPLGAGGIVSTAEDLILFAKALFSGKLVSPESLEQMKPIDDKSYGFALEQQKFEDIIGLGHGGDIDAFTSVFAYFEEEDVSFALISNGVNYGKHDIATAVLSEIMEKPYDFPTFQTVELSSEALDAYLGTYETEELAMDFVISKEENKLYLGITGQAPGLLSAEGNHKFSIIKYGVKVTFTPDENKMRFQQNGMTFDLKLKMEAKAEEVKTVSDNSNEDLSQYLGTYESDELPIDLTISKEGGKLMGQGTGQSAFELLLESNHTFYNDEIGLTITFIPEDKKLHFEQGGMEFEMKLGE